MSVSPEKSYDDVRAAFDSGTVLVASRQELEQLLLAVGRARVLDPANQARAAEMGETMRLLLAARNSAELQSNANRISKIALWVSVFALLFGAVQALVALGLLPPISSP